MTRLRRFINWADECYMGLACMIVGIPLVGLIVMEIVCWWYLGIINDKLAMLEAMF